MLDLIRRIELAGLRVIRKSRLTARAILISEDRFWIRQPVGHLHSDNHRDEHERFYTVASISLNISAFCPVAMRTPNLQSNFHG